MVTASLNQPLLVLGNIRFCLQGSQPAFRASRDLIRAFQRTTRASSAVPRALRLQLYGFVEGLKGVKWSDFSQSSLPMLENKNAGDSLDAKIDAFWKKVHEKQISANGLNPRAQAFANNFLEGAGEFFRYCEKVPYFLRITSRLWGATERFPQLLPMTDEDRAVTIEAGRRIGRTLLDDYETGLEGGISRLLLNQRLHLRNVAEYLATKGWLLGSLEFIRREREEFDEISEILPNMRSIFFRAFRDGHINHPAEELNREILNVQGIHKSTRTEAHGR